MTAQLVDKLSGAKPASGGAKPTRQRVLLGTGLGFASAVIYTAANMCLRSVVHCDPIWVSCVKAMPTVVMVLPWILSRIMRGAGLIASPRDAMIVAVTALLAQVLGNVGFQWSLGVVGLALCVPLTLGTVILGSTYLGRYVLRESVTKRMAVGLILLILSICVLSVGAGEANRALQDSDSGNAAVPASLIAAGVIAACLAGLAYSALGAGIRWSAERGTPVSVILFISGIIGIVVLGSLLIWDSGTDEIRSTTSADLRMMLLAGVLNALAFAALVWAMHATGLVYVNALNASQTGMAAVAGIVFFDEAVTPALALGVSLTVAGLLLMRRRRKSG